VTTDVDARGAGERAVEGPRWVACHPAPMTAASEPTRASRSPARQGVVLVAVLAAVMWVVEVVDQLIGERLDRYGIEPRDADGLTGIVAAPFLHGGFDHLVANTIPFLILGAAIALSGAARVIAVTAVVAVVGGLGTWLVAPQNTIHIGASGIVFGYAAYLIARGLYSRGVLHLAVGAVVLLLWGGTLLSGVLPAEGVSWQGHLFGAIGGVVAARMLHRRDAREDRPGAVGRRGATPATAAAGRRG
jgi:membrane associated rhomboid family serine protease